MPISSGALEWPASYYNRPDREAMEVIEGGTTAGKKSPRDGYEWTPQLSSREDYEKWRRKMDRKDPLKTRRKKPGGCCGCFASNKINMENEDPTKGEPRDSPREIIRRHRRRRCLLLALIVTLFTFLLLAVFVFVFLRYTGHEVIGPEDLIECTGIWGRHFLAHAERSSNGTTTYTCCYIPKLENYTAWYGLQNSGWPSGFLFDDATKCSQPSTDCKSETTSDYLKFGVTEPCDGCCRQGPLCRVVLSGLLAWALMTNLCRL